MHPASGQNQINTGDLKIEVDQTDHLTPKSSSARQIGAKRKPTLVVMCATFMVAGISLLVELDPKHPDASKGAAVLIITACWWFTEVVPLTITAFLPIMLFPLLGIVKASEIAGKFFGGTTFLFAAGFLISLAVERWDLHTRIVCAIVTRTKNRIELVILAFMVVSWFLSMWISNTATTLCVLPIAEAFLATLPQNQQRLKSAFLLAVGYSATIGGISTPVGTPTNGVFMEYFALFWPSEGEFPFAKFVLCALPFSAFLLVLVWLAVCTLYVWTGGQQVQVDTELFQRMYSELGKSSFEQIVVGVDLFVLAILWLTATPLGDFKGWKPYVAQEINSGVIGLALTLPLFFIPCGSRLPQWFRRLVGENRSRPTDTCPEPHHILDWESVKHDFQWEILFIFGGGLTLAHGTVKCGLAAWIAERLAETHTSEFGFIALVVFIMCFMTEVVSNTSAISIFGSVVAAAAESLGHDPVQLLLAATLAASLAFMLPIATPPNLIIYSTGKVGMKFMAASGLLLNLAACVFGALYVAWVMPALLGSYKRLPPLMTQA